MSAGLWLSAHKKVPFSIHASQGSAATSLRCGKIFNDSLIAIFSAERASERITKIR